MNDLFPEMMAELKRQQIKEDLSAIRLEEEAGKGKNLLSKNLAALGDWMVSRGEKLRKQNSSIHAIPSELAKKVA